MVEKYLAKCFISNCILLKDKCILLIMVGFIKVSEST
jgi:hypothetical protein